MKNSINRTVLQLPICQQGLPKHLGEILGAFLIQRITATKAGMRI
jgi:hypothetical protein